MKRTVLSLIAAASLIANACSSSQPDMRSNDMAMKERMPMQSRMTTDGTTAMIGSWPMESQKAAMAAMETYGPPNEATATMLVWHNNGPWKRSIVYSHEVQHDFPMPHKDVWQQVVDYRVAPDKFDDLAAYDGSVVVDRTQGEMSARCDKEGANFLALNLADDVVNGRRSVADARQFYAATIKAKMAGQSSPYLEGLRFQTMRLTRDPDMAMMKGSESEMTLTKTNQ